MSSNCAITASPEYDRLRSNIAINEANSCNDINLSPVSSPYTPARTPDTWELPEIYDHRTPWIDGGDLASLGELPPPGKYHRVSIILRTISLFSLLFIFIISLDFLSTAFRLIGGKYAGQIISESEVVRNPIGGLIIGILVTVLVQSSSTSTSIAVTLVASELIRVKEAIPIVMGANIGTSITNTIVSLMQASDRNEFRLAFAAATVHDMFNWLTVIVLLPLEVTTSYLESASGFLVNITNVDRNGEPAAGPQFVKSITKAITSIFVELDSDVIQRIILGNVTEDDTLLKKTSGALLNSLGLKDSLSGIILLVTSLIMLSSCLILMVKILHSLLKGKIATLIKKYVNAEYELPWSLLLDYMAIFMGCMITVLVQSSSVFTSALTPLAGIGVISLERVYPLTLGSNVGTTTTGILAAMTADNRVLKDTLQLAFCHLLFNITGILIFYPIPFMRLPIRLARMLGNITAEYRWFSGVYLISLFLLIPGFFFLISLGGPRVFAISLIITFVLLSTIITINIIQARRPSWLPLRYQTWDWLPLWMHSLDPLDNFLTRLLQNVSFLQCCVPQQRGHDVAALGMRTNQSQLHILDGSRCHVCSSSENHLAAGFDDLTIIEVNGKKYTSVKDKESTHL
ncbi:sodium-dependent phosphate transport protein 2B-like [Brevipalpus obovatus]|uniref:sodium-dependent phosphate transport protein 2B-like n=1 Tax=Brevipalpus obovatus TaxID=246614 RepID=UPI003D9E0EC4